MGLEWSDASAVFLELTSLRRDNDGRLDRLLDELQKSAVRYAEFRARCALVSSEEKAAIDRERSTAHDVFIDACNALSRAMVDRGYDVTWRKRLGDPLNRESRKTIRDLASFIHCFLALSAR